MAQHEKERRKYPPHISGNVAIPGKPVMAILTKFCMAVY